jgi:hypothetical protein
MVLGSNLCPGTGYTEVFPDFPQALKTSARIVHQTRP